MGRFRPGIECPVCGSGTSVHPPRAHYGGLRYRRRICSDTKCNHVFYTVEFNQDEPTRVGCKWCSTSLGSWTRRSDNYESYIARTMQCRGCDHLTLTIERALKPEELPIIRHLDFSTMDLFKNQ